MNYNDDEFERKSLEIQNRIKAITDKRHKELDNILSKDKLNFEALVERGNILLNKSRAEKALNDFNSAIDIKNDDYRPFFHVYEILFTKDRMESYRYLRKAFNLNFNLLKVFNHFLKLFLNSITMSEFIEKVELDLQNKPKGKINQLLLATLNYSKGNYSVSLSFLNKALDLDPRYFVPYLVKSKVLLNLEKGSEALVEINKAIDLKPKEDQLYLVKSDVHLFMKNLEDAVISCKKAIDLFENNWSAHISLGKIYIKQQKQIEAIKSFSTAIGIGIPLGVDPHRFTEVFYLRGTITYYTHTAIQIKTEKEYKSMLQVYNLKLKDLSTVIEHDPKYPKAHLYRGRYHSLSNNNEKAISDFETALKIDAKDEEVLAELFSIYNKMKKFTEANKYIDKAIEINPANTKYFYDRGLANFNNQKLEESAIDFTKYIEKSPNHKFLFLGHFYRGSAYYYNKQYEKAKFDFGKTIDLNQNDHQAHLNRGNCLRNLGDYKNAILDYDMALRIKPNYINAYLTRSDLYNFLEEFEKSVSDLQKVTELDPNKLASYYNLGQLYLRLKENDKAENILKKGIEITSARPEPSLYYSLGVVYALSNNLNDSFEFFEKAIEIDARYIGTIRKDQRLDDIREDKKFKIFFEKIQK